MNILIYLGFLKCPLLMFYIFLRKDFVYPVDSLLATFRFPFSYKWNFLKLFFPFIAPAL